MVARQAHRKVGQAVTVGIAVDHGILGRAGVDKVVTQLTSGTGKGGVSEERKVLRSSRADIGIIETEVDPVALSAVEVADPIHGRQGLPGSDELVAGHLEVVSTKTADQRVAAGTALETVDPIAAKQRINAIASPAAVRAIASIYLLLPQIPMLFMGEEWDSNQPFPYFCDFEGDLGEKIRKGRREEFASFPEFKDPEQRDKIPDPLARETFLSAKLEWRQTCTDVHAEWLSWYRGILKVRHERIVPLLQEVGGFAGSYHVISDGAVLVCWTLEAGRALVLAANLSNDSIDNFATLNGDVLWHEGPELSGSAMRPWSVRWLIASGEAL